MKKTDKYLGQVISYDSKNTKDILKMKNKGIGLQKQKNKCQTQYKMEYFIFKQQVYTGIPTSYQVYFLGSKVLYGLTQAKYKHLESKIWIMIFVNCYSCVPTNTCNTM